MAVAAGVSLIDRFAALKDPRQGWKVVYPLPEVLLPVPRGTLAGAGDFVEIRRRGLLHLEFLRRFRPFARGIPSHDAHRPGSAPTPSGGTPESTGDTAHGSRAMPSSAGIRAMRRRATG